MKFINPRTDFAFKRIFGSDSDTSKLISLLNAVLQADGAKSITEIKILNPYNGSQIPLLKESYLDLRARDASGKYYLIEMQVANVQGMHKRVLYNACKQYGNQLDKGDEYVQLNDVIGITFTNFVLFEHNPNLRSSFMLRDQIGNTYTEDLELIFIELPKFNIGKDQLQQLRQPLDKWLYFLKHVDDLQTRPTEFDHDLPLCSAFDAASVANLAKDELDLYENSLKYIRDQRGRIAYALDQGLQRGMQQGLQQGIQQGLKQGRQEGLQQGLSKAALALKQQGLSVANIAQALQIDVSEVEQMLS